MSDRQVGLVLLLFSGVMYWQTYQIRTPGFVQFQQIDAPFFPRLILGFLAALSLLLVIRGRGGTGLPNRAALVDFGRRYRDVLVTLGLFVLYVIGITVVGWLPATIVYVVALQLILNPNLGRRLVYVVGGSVAFSWFLAFVFEQYLHVVLPRGMFY